MDETQTQTEVCEPRHDYLRNGAMLKISQITGPLGTCRLKLEGKLLQPWISELLAACQPHFRNVSKVELDLASVSFVDSACLQCLLRLIGQGIQVVATSPFVQALLNEKGKGEL